MKQERRAQFIKYLICFAVASLIAFVVFWIKGFFVYTPSVNLQILADGFFVSGILVTMYALLLYLSSQGAFIGIGFLLKSVVLTFIPMGRKKHEIYAKYRERKLSEMRKTSNICVLITGLAFLLVGVVLTYVWSVKYYQ